MINLLQNMVKNNYKTFYINCSYTANIPRKYKWIQIKNLTVLLRTILAEGKSINSSVNTKKTREEIFEFQIIPSVLEEGKPTPTATWPNERGMSQMIPPS